MPKLIVTSRYLKSGNRKNMSHYVKYIATRPGVVLNKADKRTLPVMQNQQQLIDSIIKEFPETTEMFEYDDYIKSLNQKTASKLIGEIIERNSDRIANRENYVKYLSNRPGAVKLGEHGLFSQEDKPIELKAVAKEIANHKGTVWTHVVSLRRDNAEQTGYTDVNSWRELVKRKIPVIAEASKISMKNLKWYAAFHDKETNPHVHIVVYSTDPKEGFLTNKGIEKIRSAFANDIYHDELYNLYGRQTALRDDLKKESAELMHQLAIKIKAVDNSTEDLKKSVLALSEQLSNYRGRKYYKYLPPEIKANVDNIFLQLTENKSIQKMYALWCEMEQQKHDIYSSAKVEFPPMADNPAFYSVKNKIINAVSEMDVLQVEPTNIIPPEPLDNDSDDNFSSEIVQVPAPIPNEFKDSGEVVEVKELYANGESVCKDDAEKQQYYEQALAGFLKLETNDQADDNLFYKLGRMYMHGLGTDKDTTKALDYFKRSAELNNKNALYEYGKALLLGENTEQDIPQGLDMIQKAVALGNSNGKRFLALEYISGKHIEQDIDKGIEMLTELAGNGDSFSAYKLGKIYLSGEIVFKDLDRAEKYLRQASDDNNEFAIYALAKLYLSDEKKDLSKAVALLEKVCYNEKLKPFAAYTYAKILLENNDFHDTPKAIKLLEETVDDNSWCSFLLGKLYLLGNDDIGRNKEEAIKWLTKSAEAGNEYAEALIQHSEDYENAMLTNSIFGLFVSLSRMIEDDYSRSQHKMQSKVDKKLQRIIEKRKEEAGQKSQSVALS